MYVYTATLTDQRGNIVHRNPPCRVDKPEQAYSAAMHLTRDFPTATRVVVDIVLPPAKDRVQ